MSRKIFLYLSLIFIAFHLLSIFGFFYLPVRNIAFVFILLATISLAFYKFEYALLILLAEFLFGQAGHFFEFRNISLRLALLLSILIFWLIRKIVRKEEFQFLKSNIFIYLVILSLFILIAFFKGFIGGNQKILAIRDFISYGYFLLVFPLVDFFKKEENKIHFSKILIVAIVGVSLFTLLNLFLYSQQLVRVHDQYYRWIRNIAIGKITALPDNFFRIVFPSHLWLVPVFLILVSCFLTKKIESKLKNNLLILSILISLAILTNFSRIYFLALLFGLCFLKINLSWRKWIVSIIFIVLILILEFFLLYFLVTGQLTGGRLLGQRMETIYQPEEELSALTRLSLLPELKNKISENFLFGTGLGTEISFIEPITQLPKTTYHLDWGWFEMPLELGFFGLLAYLIFLANLFYRLFQKICLVKSEEKRLYIGLLAGLASLVLANLTGPFLFHSLGIFYQVMVISFL